MHNTRLNTSKGSFGKRFHKFVTLESDNSWKLLLYPGMALLFILTIVPTLYALIISFQEYNLANVMGRKFVWFGNYMKVLSDERFWNSVSNTAIFSTIALLFEVVIGLALAIVLSKKLFMGNLAKSLIMIPMFTTPVVVGLVWKMFFDAQFGSLSYFMSSVGLPVVDFLGNPKLALLALIIVDIWEWTPFVTLILLAGLQSLPREPFEAAEVDGASRVQIFLHITLHMLRPALAVAIVFRFMDLFKWYDTVYVITTGGPGTATETMSFYAYAQGFRLLNSGYASAICIILLICTMLICNLIANKIFFKDDD